MEENCFDGKVFPIQLVDKVEKDYQFDVDFNIGFDDFAAINPLSYSDAEIMKYTDF